MSIMTDENTRNGVQRNLFGTIPSDHLKTQESMIREANRITLEKSQKWNFDFATHQPLPGRYKWKRVGKRLETRRSPSPDEVEERANSLHDLSTRHYNLRQRNTLDYIERDHAEANQTNQANFVVEGPPRILNFKSSSQGTYYTLTL